MYAYDNSTIITTGSLREAGITRESRFRSCPYPAFPVLDKQLLMEHFNELVTVSDLNAGGTCAGLTRRKAQNKKNLRMSTMWSILPASTGAPGYFVL